MLLPVIYAGMAAIALMAVPVVGTPHGPQTALGERYIEEPILGVVQSYDPHWLSVLLQIGVVAIAPMVLTWAAATSMLGLSRHVYALATNRQVPSWLGKLSPRSTPVHRDPDRGGDRVRSRAPDRRAACWPRSTRSGRLSRSRSRTSRSCGCAGRARSQDRPYRIPFNVPFRGKAIPIPAVLGAVLMSLLWLAVIVFHSRARWVGGGWMVFGLIAYVVYRKYVEGVSLTKRVSVPEQALRKEVRAAEYGNILVPDLRDQARRRHRGDGGTAGGRGR